MILMVSSGLVEKRVYLWQIHQWPLWAIKYVYRSFCTPKFAVKQINDSALAVNSISPRTNENKFNIAEHKTKKKKKTKNKKKKKK